MSRSRPFAVGVAQSVAWIALGGAALRIVPEFEKIFRDFGTTLPAPTVFLLGLTHFLNNYWYLAILPAAVWPFVNWAVVSLLSPRPEVVLAKQLWYVVTWATLPLAVMFGVVALFTPLIVDISNLSSGPVVQ